MFLFLFIQLANISGSVSYNSNWNVSQEKCKDTIPRKITNICTNINHDDRRGIWLPIKKEALSIDISDGMYEFIN